MLNEQTSSATQILEPSVEIVSNSGQIEDITPTYKSPVPKHLKVSCSLSQDDIDLAQPLATPEKSAIYSDVDSHKLEISISPMKNHIEYNRVGRRILDLAYVCQQIKEKDNHGPYSFSFEDMVCVGEKKIGLKSTFTFKCNFCLKIYVIDSERSETHMTDINIAAVAGIMNVGGGFSQLQAVTASLEIPPLSQFMYNKSHDTVCKSFNQCATKEMEGAAKEEAQLALSIGDIDTDGTPLISVVADGSWCKRSYRSTYNSLSGAVSICDITYTIHGKT